MTKVTDAKHNDIKVGTKAKIYGTNDICEVIEITDAETDYDDGAQGPVTYLPVIKVSFVDRINDEFSTWQGPNLWGTDTYICEDLEVVTSGT